MAGPDGGSAWGEVNGPAQMVASHGFGILPGKRKKLLMARPIWRADARTAGESWYASPRARYRESPFI